jgi:preprotein translocase subunit SecG
MLTLIIILIILACFVLGFFVLIQNSKGGGLASNFAGSNQIMGVRKTADFLEKATWTLAGSIMLLCLIVAFLTKQEFKRDTPDARRNVEQVADEEE